MRLSAMPDVQQRGNPGVYSPPSTREELVESIRSDFQALAAIMARQELQGDQPDGIPRAKAAIERGIELSDWLSAGEQGKIGRSFR
jgi:hypothetical protein